MSHETLCLIWFFLLAILIIGYSILDGFDLGVGILHLTARGDTERRTMMTSIGPTWDGNEVWLLTFGGAMFAAFPEAYATVFSGFYIAFMLLLFSLIFRAVSLEVRSKSESLAWRKTWDAAFSISSFVAALLFGVAAGNIIAGMASDETRTFTGTIINQLMPYPIVIGLLSVALFAMHGAIYAHLKTEGDLQHRIAAWMWRTYIAFIVLYIVATAYTLIAHPSAMTTLNAHPWLWIVPVVNILAIANIGREIRLGRSPRAFAMSCITIALLLVLFSIAIFPNLVISSLNPDWNITIYNAASSSKTLTTMFIIVLIGMPLVLIYTAVVYRVFHGKVKLDESSY